MAFKVTAPAYRTQANQLRAQYEAYFISKSEYEALLKKLPTVTINKNR